MKNGKRMERKIFAIPNWSKNKNFVRYFCVTGITKFHSYGKFFHNKSLYLLNSMKYTKEILRQRKQIEMIQIRYAL